MMSLPNLRLWLLPLLAVLANCGLILPSGHDPRAYTPVFAAASAGDMAVLRAALDGNPDLVKATEWDGATLLHDAVEHDQLEAATLLLDRGARVDATTSDGLTPLHKAAQNGNLAMIRLLLARGAPINPIDAKRWTPLDRAVKWQHPEAADALRAQGGRPGS